MMVVDLKANPSGNEEKRRPAIWQIGCGDIEARNEAEREGKGDMMLIQRSYVKCER